MQKKHNRKNMLDFVFGRGSESQKHPREKAAERINRFVFNLVEKRILFVSVCLCRMQIIIIMFLMILVRSFSVEYNIFFFLDFSI